MKQQSLILVIFSLVLPLLVAGVYEGRPMAEWKRIDNLEDPHIVDLGKYAVAEWNKEKKTRWEFVKVVKCESQEVPGSKTKAILYRIRVNAKDGTTPKRLEYYIEEERKEDHKHLTSFDLTDEN